MTPKYHELAILLFCLLFGICSVNSFYIEYPKVRVSQKTPTTVLRLSSWNQPGLAKILSNSFALTDTSISEEDVLAVTGQINELPSPFYVVIAAGLIFIGVAVLQFSLGDLTKEEGQARVRDFLQTRRDTERKRGYFDDKR